MYEYNICCRTYRRSPWNCDAEVHGGKCQGLTRAGQHVLARRVHRIRPRSANGLAAARARRSSSCHTFHLAQRLSTRIKPLAKRVWPPRNFYCTRGSAQETFAPPGKPRKLASFRRRLPASLTSSTPHSNDIGHHIFRRCESILTSALSCGEAHTRKDVFSIAAKALGDERRRDQCLGW